MLHDTGSAPGPMGGKLCPLSPPGVRAGTLSPLRPLRYHQLQLSEPRGKSPALARGSAAIPEQAQALKAKVAKPSPTLPRTRGGSQGCPPPGTLERRSAQASESPESREHWEHGEKPELKITAGRDDLPSPVLPSDRHPLERGCGSRQRGELSLSGSRLATAMPPAVKSLAQPCREGQRERGSAARARRQPPARAAKLPVPPPASQDRDGKFRWAAMSTSRKRLTLETYSPPSEQKL